MSLEVTIVEAKNLPNTETFGKSDPYVILEFQGIRKKTEVVKGDLNPKWNQTFTFPLSGTGLTAYDELTVTVFDWERVGRNRRLGTAKVLLYEFQTGGQQEKLVTLKDSNDRELQACTIQLYIKVEPPAEGDAAGGDKVMPGGGQVVELGDVDLDDDEEDVVAGKTPAEPGQAKQKPKVKRRKGRMSERQNLSTKPLDLQIRVKVVQARQLSGANLQPVVRVSVMNQMKQTRIKKSTTSPWFDESFFFNFHVAPAELVDEIIDFSVYNSRTLRADALIGSFKCDVGLIYDEPQHALVNKWVLLSDPEDASLGARGYLKISSCVLGPGDVSPNMAAKQNDEDEDIESNLLRPAGVQLRPATFTLRVYCAEDIPRMDSAFLEGVKKVFRMAEEPKELVDPYFVFGFAGKEVTSKIMYANDHPDWYQDLKIGLQFPSMCERLKLQVKDWDRLNADDTVGTLWLPVSSISSNGEQVVWGDAENWDAGFLPSFGPCYINLYGSTREYSDLPDDYEDLNMGKGEGVAYRGRVLVELVTTLGELPEKALEDQISDDKLRVQKYMRRRKFRVHAAFLNASMICPSHADSPIEFEVSIGNYGNKLDENVPPSPSTTQPTNGVFDGCYYYFLPWAGTKPCVVVDCSWEDVSWRLESLNMLLNIVETISANIERIRIGMKAKLPVPELAQLLISLLDRLIKDCGVELSTPRDGKHVPTELDKLMLIHRQTQLTNIKNLANSLRENATDLDEALTEVENLMAMLQNLAIEPQNSMPDVIIWMLSGQKRIAYYRIPANELLYSDDAMKRGKHCGQLMTLALNYPCAKDKDRKFELPALLRVKLWLGLTTQESAWHKMQNEGDLAVYAETYENQVNILGTWTNKGPTMSRPKWSDSEGRLELNKDDFKPPPGWEWEEDWYISPEMSMMFDKDAGHQNYLEDAYECQSRNIPGTAWGPASRPWTDVKGDPCPDKAAVPLPAGWTWDDDWQIDLNRAVDEEGYEYCVEATVGGYGAVEKTYHLCRRRRWVRPRTFVKGVNKKQEEQQKKSVEGWEYAPLFNMKFHAQERTMDLVRRRRWHRKMISTGKGGACFFNLQHELENIQSKVVKLSKYGMSLCTDCVKTQKDADKELQELASLAAPRMFLTYGAPHKYQLRAYIYQARDVIAADDSGLSDPFARVSFMTHSMATEIVKKTLCPTWDQTLIFSEINIYGDPKALETNAPEAYIELFDHDAFGQPDFLGRTKAQVMVKLDPADGRTAVLQWYPVTRLGQDGGELLAAFELIKIPEGAIVENDELTGKDMPFLPPKRGDLYIVPNGIRPVMQRTGIEVLCWGVRNMKRYQLSAVTSPSVRFECGGHAVDSMVIKDTRRNPNFAANLLFFDVMLPREELYMPPMNIRVKDHRQFGRKPTVGVHVLKSLEDFRIEPPTDVEAPLVELPSNGVLQLPTTSPTTTIQIQDPEKAAASSAVSPDSLASPDFVVDMPDSDKDKRKSKKRNPVLMQAWVWNLKQFFLRVKSKVKQIVTGERDREAAGESGTKKILTFAAPSETSEDTQMDARSEDDNGSNVAKWQTAVKASKEAPSTPSVESNKSATVSRKKKRPKKPKSSRNKNQSNSRGYGSTLSEGFTSTEEEILRRNVNNSSIFTTVKDVWKWKQVSKEKRDRLEYLARVRQINALQESDLTAMELDWWSKFYASTNDLDKCKKYRMLGYDTLQILPKDLEKSVEHAGFNDFCHTLALTRGKNEDDEDDNVIGEFKGSFRIYPLPPDPSEPLPPKVFQLLPPSDPEECIIRLYVIRAVDLQPGDPNGLADPYLEVKLGKTKLTTRDDYIPNTINPTFGRFFEMKALIPLNKDLIVRVKDYDMLSSDDVIGETTVDLENRYLTNYRATCGLPKTYWITGINKWRDSQLPLDILKWYCLKNRLSEPQVTPTQLTIGSKIYKLTDFEPVPPINKHLGPVEQRLALHVLNLLPLVKEHVESRPIYNPLQPNIEQGRLHMWVDIFPMSLGPPGPPLDVSPRKPQTYVLRAIIWNTKDVILEEESITGEKMSDIFVKGWMAGIDEKQKTDVHYRSLDGEGNFNWRMVFPFDYQVAEQTMIVKKKEHFWSLDTTTQELQPKYVVQIWDNDKFSADDFIGHLELNLNAMPMPAKWSRACKLTQLPDVGKDVKLVSLFEMKHMRGFWPCYDDSTGERVLTGKVELELELLTETQAKERPAGLGQDEPNMNPKLEPPNRPDTSFVWFLSPWKTFKHVIWRNYGCMIICSMLLCMLIVLIAMFIYSFPGLAAEMIVDTFKDLTKAKNNDQNKQNKPEA